MSLEGLLYVRKALGKEGRKIKLYKIRTMIPNADEFLEEIFDRDFDHHGHPNEDERITGIGRFLRRYWIDEIPQFYNLFKGDLKLVGIRPLPEEWWKLYPPELKNRALKEKPGLMGVQYAYKAGDGFEDHVERLGQYLDERGISPTLTDVKYFFKILSNIIFRGVRGG